MRPSLEEACQGLAVTSLCLSALATVSELTEALRRAGAGRMALVIITWELAAFRETWADPSGHCGAARRPRSVDGRMQLLRDAVGRREKILGGESWGMEVASEAKVAVLWRQNPDPQAPWRIRAELQPALGEPFGRLRMFRVLAVLENGRCVAWLPGCVVFEDRFEEGGWPQEKLHEDLVATVGRAAEEGTLRFLTGVLAATPGQVASFLTGSGAASPGPMMCAFSPKSGGGSRWSAEAVAVPLYLAWYGPASPTVDKGPEIELGEYPELPQWLTWGEPGGLGQAMFHFHQAPRCVRRLRDPKAPSPSPSGAQPLGPIAQRRLPWAPDYVVEVSCEFGG